MEIYNEEINDLLAPEHRKLQIHENIEVLILYGVNIVMACRCLKRLLFVFVFAAGNLCCWATRRNCCLS